MQIVDVSHHNEDVDWKKLIDSGVEGAIIRAGYGVGTIDKKFYRNVQECKRLNIPFGVYWFSYAFNSERAIQEANYCLNVVRNYKPLFIAFDYEKDSLRVANKTQNQINNYDISKIADSFIRVIDESGFKSVHYMSYSYLTSWFSYMESQPFRWVAYYNVSKEDDVKEAKASLWQWTDKYMIGGKKFDMNKVLDERLFKEDKQNNVASWGLDSWKKAYEKGILDGTRPKDSLTRQELAVVLDRLHLLD